MKSIPFETYNPKYLDIYVYPTERNNPINGIDPHTTQNLHRQGTSGLVGLFDLAELYEVENRALKQAVRRNADRFPDDFMFQLNKSERHELITICDNLPEGAKFSPAMPYAFTEQDVSILSSVLRSLKAIRVNIAIMRAFVMMRQFALSHAELTNQRRELEQRYDR